MRIEIDDDVFRIILVKKKGVCGRSWMAKLVYYKYRKNRNKMTVLDFNQSVLFVC